MGTVAVGKTKLGGFKSKRVEDECPPCFHKYAHILGHRTSVHGRLHSCPSKSFAVNELTMATTALSPLFVLQNHNISQKSMWAIQRQFPTEFSPERIM